MIRISFVSNSSNVGARACHIAVPSAANMQRNTGGFERGVRIGIGVVLLVWVLLDEGDARMWGFVGLWPLATGFLGWCPVYSLMGMTIGRLATHLQSTRTGRTRT